MRKVQRLTDETLRNLFLKEYNSDTSIPRDINPEDIVRTTCITSEDVEITG